MFTAMRLQTRAAAKPSLLLSFPSTNRSRTKRLQIPSATLPSFSSLSLSNSHENARPSLVSSVGSPPSLPLAQWNLSSRHIRLLNVIACVAFKRASESLEKLLDVTREELPDTMAAVRLSGMEISNLTMELSDLGQEITQGVRSSTRAVRLAEDRLRCLATMTPTVLMQDQAIPKTEITGPAMARTARNLREGIVKSRAVIQVFFSLSQFSRLAMNYLAGRGWKL